ncbi:MAG: lipase [Gemmatimonadetes bacterium]|nr:lipase [Gemmatimonadota bacterium]
MHSIPGPIQSIVWVAVLTSVTALSSEAASDARQEGLRFATIHGRELYLDLYVPETPHCLIIWVHGGRWWRGSRDACPTELVDKGYALASVDYRLATEAVFPAQVHDIKSAIRFLRVHTDSLGYPASRMVVGGASAGGHLAALVGTTNGNPYYKGEVGTHLDASSSVQAILDLFGPTNLLTILDQSTLHGYKVRAPAVALLLGADVIAVPDLARKASPVHQVDASDPPLLIIHGD